jgi:hypothetical protein
MRPGGIPAGRAFAPIARNHAHLTPEGSLYVAGLLKPELSVPAK